MSPQLLMCRRDITSLKCKLHFRQLGTTKSILDDWNKVVGGGGGV